jgi:hypothetical protein
MPRTLTHSSLRNIAGQVNTCIDELGFPEHLAMSDHEHMRCLHNPPLRGVAIQAAPA